MALYIKYSSRIYSIYLRYVSPDDIHVYSIDECFIDATDYLKLYKLSAEDFARKLIESVLEETGITATAGIGSNLYLAKIAMDIIAKHVKADEKGVRIASLDVLSYREKLWNHKPLTDFWRIGPGIAERLAKYRIYTMGELARFSINNSDAIFREFGVDGEILIDHAFGEESTLMCDIKRYKPKESSLSNGQVLSYPYDYEKGRLIVQEMAEELSYMLLERSAEAGAISLYIGYDRENVDKGIVSANIQSDYYGRSVPKSVHGIVHRNTVFHKNNFGILSAYLQYGSYIGIKGSCAYGMSRNLVFNHSSPYHSPYKVTGAARCAYGGYMVAVLVKLPLKYA